MDKYRFENQHVLQYLKSQLNLYAALCKNRNINSGKYFKGELFPIQTLVQYIFMDNFDQDIKAIFCELIINLYIDKKPRFYDIKPNLVIFKYLIYINIKYIFTFKFIYKTFIIINMWLYIIICNNIYLYIFMNACAYLNRIDYHQIYI